MEQKFPTEYDFEHNIEEAKIINEQTTFVGSPEDEELYRKRKAAEDAERALREKALKGDEEYNLQ